MRCLVQGADVNHWYSHNGAVQLMCAALEVAKELQIPIPPLSASSSSSGHLELTLLHLAARVSGPAAFACPCLPARHCVPEGSFLPEGENSFLAQLAFFHDEGMPPSHPPAHRPKFASYFPFPPSSLPACGLRIMIATLFLECLDAFLL